MDIHKYQIVITKHAFDRALSRGMHPDRIEQVLCKGKMLRYGKYGVKFIGREIIAVGQIVGDRMTIFTVEART